ncbi:MAG TPA: cytochrome-c peroxidase, partial [Polyangia bacterium]
MKLVLGMILSSLMAIGCNSSINSYGDAGPQRPIDMAAPSMMVGPQPQFGATVTAATPPPPLSGGTLLVLKSGNAFVADPDRDQAYVVDLGKAALLSTVALSAGDEPGRAVEDAAGKVHVVLRRGGAVALIDPATATVVERKAVCPAPRGIAYEAASDRIHVACAGGELVSLPAAGGDPVRTLTLERDLRDVAVVGTQLWISTFRTAQIIVLDANGAAVQRLTLPSSFGPSKGSMSPSVAWRMMALPDGHVGIAHQRGLTGPVETTPGGYGDGMGSGGCGGIVQSALTMIDGSTTAASSIGLGETVLPADFAFAPTSRGLAVLSAGNSHTPELGQVTLLSLGEIVVGGGGPDMGIPGGGGCEQNTNIVRVDGEAIAVAYDGSEHLWVQTREPAALERIGSSFAVDARVTLSNDVRADTAWAVFHSNSGANVACASCHPEGGEDARVWQFDGLGARRTQSLRGHVGGTEPFHWGGELPTFDALIQEVYLGRMAGPMLLPDQQQVL